MSVTILRDGVPVEVSDADWSEQNPPLAIAERRDALAAYARRRSYEIRVGGTVISGAPIKTDGDSLALINGMASLAGRHADRTFNFDTDAGTVALSAADASSLADAVGSWVQGTFDRRASVLAAIAAGTLTTEAAVEAALTAPA